MLWFRMITVVIYRCVQVKHQTKSYIVNDMRACMVCTIIYIHQHILILYNIYKTLQRVFISQAGNPTPRLPWKREHWSTIKPLLTCFYITLMTVSAIIGCNVVLLSTQRLINQYLLKQMYTNLYIHTYSTGAI